MRKLTADQKEVQIGKLDPLQKKALIHLGLLFLGLFIFAGSIFYWVHYYKPLHP
jgi:hypothetical protein